MPAPHSDEVSAGQTDDKAPSCSVIVPVYRQWDLVPHLLQRLAAQKPVSGGFEVVLVDNEPKAERQTLELPDIARIIACAKPGSYAARNAGAAVARGQWFAFTDADCLPTDGWLSTLGAALNRYRNNLVAGPIDIVPQSTPANRYETYDRIRGIPQARYVRNGYAATANLAVPMNVFRTLGGFDETRFSGGDAEFCRRAGSAGHGLRLVKDAIVEHPARADWVSLATKARRVKGGQLTAGPLRRRCLYAMRTMTPPVIALWRFLRAPYPIAERLTAVGVLVALWMVELDEMRRLLLGKTPERR
ncbi:MAG: glycosyltransferase [Pseudomonadota bacterium]